MGRTRSGLELSIILLICISRLDDSVRSLSNRKFVGAKIIESYNKDDCFDFTIYISKLLYL